MNLVPSFFISEYSLNKSYELRNGYRAVELLQFSILIHTYDFTSDYFTSENGGIFIMDFIHCIQNLKIVFFRLRLNENSIGLEGTKWRFIFFKLHKNTVVVEILDENRSMNRVRINFSKIKSLCAKPVEIFFILLFRVFS